MLGRGVYLCRNLEDARRYPIGHPEHDKVVIKVEVNLGNVIVIDRQHHPRQKTWHDSRYGPVYDTASVPAGCGMVQGGQEPALSKEHRESDTDSNMEYAWDEDIFLDLSVGEFQFSDRGEDCVLDPSRIKISKTINSCPVQPSQECCARGYNDSGRKLSMYYGTTRENAQSILANGFRQSADGMLGRGIYLSTELKKAKRYPIGHPESDKVVIQVKVNVGKVISIKYQGHPRQKNWHDSRYGLVYDTAWMPPRCGILKSGSEDSCVWDPSRIQIIKIIDPRPVQPSDEGGAWTCAFLCIIIFLWIFFIFRL
ncbi:hypothetical protein ABVT39_026771 [Epinephelus coioides]